MLNRKTINVLIFLSALTAMILDQMGEVFAFRILKPLTTILVILIPLFFGNRDLKKYWNYTLVALIFCLAGDTLLMFEEKFVFGLGAFLIGHIFFTLSFISIDGFKNYRIPFILMAAFGVAYYWFLYPHLEAMAIPVLAYVVFIIIMSWQGAGLFLWKKERGFRMIMIGALLFMLSDSLIALNKFVIPFAYSGVAILSTYWTAIALLANASSEVKGDSV